MLKKIFIISLIFISFTLNPAQANDMLMDPMPSAEPAPAFSLMGMDGETHT